MFQWETTFTGNETERKEAAAKWVESIKKLSYIDPDSVKSFPNELPGWTTITAARKQHENVALAGRA